MARAITSVFLAPFSLTPKCDKRSLRSAVESFVLDVAQHAVGCTLSSCYYVVLSLQPFSLLVPVMAFFLTAASYM